MTSDRENGPAEGDRVEGPRASKPPYEVERSACHAERPGFRITELQVGPTQVVPWHLHTVVQDADDFIPAG